MHTFYHSAAPFDYSHRCSSVYFPAGVNEATFNVIIHDDELIESNEEFYIEPEIPSSAANCGVTNCNCTHDKATVIIINGDSECSSIVVCNNKKF